MEAEEFFAATRPWVYCSIAGWSVAGCAIVLMIYVCECP